MARFGDVRDERSGMTWPFCEEFDLKVRVAITDAVGDNMVVLFLLQDFDYLNRENAAPERYAWNWQEAAEAISFPGDAVIETDIVEPSAGGVGLKDHADVLITLGQWVGSGVVALMISELWQKVRRPDADSHKSKSQREQRVAKDVEDFARWAIAVQYFGENLDLERGNPDDIDRCGVMPWTKGYGLEMLAQRETDAGWHFVFRDGRAVEYSIDIDQPEGISFAQRAFISRRMPDSNVTRPRPTLRRYWRSRNPAE
jgi:hypothetical protein